MGDAGEKRNRLRELPDSLKRLFGRKPASPGNPYAYVTAPLHRGPKGRSGAAVAEVEGDSNQSFPPQK